MEKTTLATAVEILPGIPRVGKEPGQRLRAHAFDSWKSETLCGLKEDRVWLFDEEWPPRSILVLCLTCSKNASFQPGS
jgi:hypothetical protein